MKTETREIYKCDHCRKMYQIKNACIKHEKKCSKNPKNIRKCFECKHCVLKKADAWVESYDQGMIEETVTSFYCESKKVFMHPPKAEHKGNVYDFDQVENLPMPMECPKFKEIEW
jgi:hypothetical protein